MFNCYEDSKFVKYSTMTFQIAYFFYVLQVLNNCYLSFTTQTKR